MADSNVSFGEQRILGRSGLRVGALGFGSSYGAPASAYERAFERGCNYFYWGSARREGMGCAIRQLAPRNRDKLVVVLQSYSRMGTILKLSVRSGLKRLKLDYADVLLLGWFNAMPGNGIMSAAMKLKDAGIVKAIAVSCHERPMFEQYIKDPRFDIIMTRYNAAHRGAEREVFPHLDSGKQRPGVVTYTSTRWGFLVNPKFTPPGMKTPTAADCYRFALTNPNVNLALSGPSTAEEMNANLRALEAGPLSSEEMAWMKAVGDHVHQLTSKKVLANPFMQRNQ
ncbi:MAG: aldo/keto reductase [Deltaproteobacteria bacterium]|nr:aldo/keto reductase [Deltaproteobacteria bacterium]